MAPTTPSNPLDYSPSSLGGHPFITGLVNGLEPDEDLTISEWANRYRQLPREAAAEYGKYRVERTPYIKEIMDCLSPQSPVKEVTYVKSTQIGGTDGIANNLLLFTAHKRPRPCLMVLPNSQTSTFLSKPDSYESQTHTLL